MGEQVVCGQLVLYVFFGVKSQVLTKSDYICCVALDQIAMKEPFSLREMPPEGFAPSPNKRAVRTLIGKIGSELPDYDQ